jgi:hypothetical protein
VPKATKKNKAPRAPFEGFTAELPPREREWLRQTKAEHDKARAKAEAEREAIDHYIAIRDNQIPPPWLKRKAKKPVNPAGAKPRYDNPAVEAAARDVIDRGVPDTQELFFEKVRDECDARKIRYPGKTRFFEVVGPIYKNAKK